MRCVASFVLLLASCTAGAAVAVTVPFSTLATGLASGVGQPTQIVVRSQNEWTALWSRHMRAPSAPPPPPSVDFSRDMVVALFMGERPTGGYAIEVTQIERTDAAGELIGARLVEHRQQGLAVGLDRAVSHRLQGRPSPSHELNSLVAARKQHCRRGDRQW